MATIVETSEQFAARRFVLGGRVQGLGVRPAIFRLATELGLCGAVRNTSEGVEIDVEGPPRRVELFARRLPNALPPEACLTRLRADSLPPFDREAFVIERDATEGPLAARVPEDRAVCDDCRAEVQERGNRRHGYPLTSCTRCGPRYTVIRRMPFERDDTALADFPMCDSCDAEYRRPGDRRFHAQTTACPMCGPQVWLADGGGGYWAGDAALRESVARLAAGQIVALRGIGGYQLLVDATNENAVTRLRRRKGRAAKPLAVMVESLAAAERLAVLDQEERTAFCDVSAPIVLVRARAACGLAPAISPNLDTVGLMRPTTPLHALVATAFARPLVCTSGNREGDPLEYETAAAQSRLAGIADAWLHHDRQIVRPIDDSVVRVIAGRRVTIRLARGLAPLALDLPMTPPMLAVGGYLKAAAAWSNGAQAVLGPHVGDQHTLSARERLLAQLGDWQRLYRFEPQRIAHDLHPEYFSTHWALRQRVPTLAVQHHHAHVVASMLEHGWLDRPVLGVAWDGTGYGTDGTIWGGEFLEATAAAFERVARLRPFRLPGGEAAIREPWRIAVAVCNQLAEPGWLGYLDRPSWPGLAPNNIASIRQIADRPQLSPLTSSAGRLFDAAAALILALDRAEFDGQAAMRLEAAADRDEAGDYPLPLREGSLPELDWRPMFAALAADVRHRVEPGRMAMRFHRGLARGIVEVCRLRPQLPVVLSGGVFQNRLLTELVAESLADVPRPLGLPGVVPPNDGGLAAGQLVVAAARGGFLPCA